MSRPIGTSMPSSGSTRCWRDRSQSRQTGGTSLALEAATSSHRRRAPSASAPLAGPITATPRCEAAPVAHRGALDRIACLPRLSRSSALRLPVDQDRRPRARSGSIPTRACRGYPEGAMTQIINCQALAGGRWQACLQRGVQAGAGPADRDGREDADGAESGARHLAERHSELEGLAGAGATTAVQSRPTRHCERRTPRSGSSSRPRHEARRRVRSANITEMSEAQVHRAIARAVQGILEGLALRVRSRARRERRSVLLPTCGSAPSGCRPTGADGRQ
jgi:hypothetical protein